MTYRQYFIKTVLALTVSSIARPARILTLVAAYAVVAVIMSWPYVNYREFASASYGGDAQLILWTLAWDNHAVLTRAPLFDANVFFPAAQSLQYNEHLFGVSLFTLPWAAAGASPILAYNATWWLAWVINGITAFALLRRFVGSALASFVGSLAFVCSFYVMLHAHGHLHLIWLWPVPLSMLLLERWFDTPRLPRLAAWVVVALLGILTSWYMAVILSVANAVMALVVATTAPRRGVDQLPAPAAVWRRRGLHLALAAVVVAACVYPFARHYVGLRAAPGEAAALSADLAAYLVPPENTIAGRWWLANIDRQPRSIWGEQTLFAGWIALILAAVGLAALVRGRHESRRAWVFPLLTLTGFLLSLGPAPPLLGGALAPFGWLTALPGFGGMRAPARFALLLTLGVAGLAAIGVPAIGRAGGWKRVATAALVPIMLAEWFVVDFPARIPAPQPIPAIYQTAAVRAARSLVSLPDYRNLPEWARGGDYLYYSTAHWRPIVNGFGRAEPPGHAEAMQVINRFPDSADEIRRLGVQYVVVHADRFADHAEPLLARARENPACRLVEQLGSDYLFEIVVP